MKRFDQMLAVWLAALTLAAALVAPRLRGQTASPQPATAAAATPYPVRLAAFQNIRTIGALWLGDIHYVHVASATQPISAANVDNPCGWNSQFFVNGKFSSAAALQWFLAEVPKVKAANCDAVILWDWPGGYLGCAEPNQNVAYYGDPEYLTDAGGMDAQAEAFLANLEKNGIRTGMTIRPQEIETLPAPANVRSQFDKWQGGVDGIVRKEAFANSRWGCTVFYVDSSVSAAYGTLQAVNPRYNAAGTTPGAFPGTALTALNPNFLNFFEWTQFDCWGYVGAYAEFVPGSAQLTNNLFPELIASWTAQTTAQQAALQSLLQAGNLNLVHL
jgi:hypothetical protein